MLDDVLQSIDNVKDKDELLRVLQSFLQITQQAENDYKVLIELIENLETSPLWIIDLKGNIFLQNQKSKSYGGILKLIDFSQEESEVELHNHFFLVKVQKNRTNLSLPPQTLPKIKKRIGSSRWAKWRRT